MQRFTAKFRADDLVIPPGIVRTCGLLPTIDLALGMRTIQPISPRACAGAGKGVAGDVIGLADEQVISQMGKAAQRVAGRRRPADLGVSENVPQPYVTDAVAAWMAGSADAAVAAASPASI